MLKRTLVLLLMALFLLAFLPSQEGQSADPEGPVAVWSFDGTLHDRAGTVEDDLSPRHDRGAGEGARFADAAEVPGTKGKALALGVQPGDAQYLTAPLSRDLELGSTYTIEAWIYPTALATWNRLVLRWGPQPRYAYHLALHQRRLSLYHGPRDGPLVCAEGGGLTPDRWYHVVGVARRDPQDTTRSTLGVYLNGRKVGRADFDGTAHPAGDESLGVGDSAGAPSAGSRFRGYLDGLRIWKRPLSAREIRECFDTRAEVLRDLEMARRQAEIARRAELAGKLEALGVEEIIFAERAAGRDPAGHYYANFGYSCIDPDYWIHGRDGGSLCRLNLRTGELKRLVDDPEGAVRDPQVHYDAQKILFSYRRGGTHHYNLYEIHVDGTGLRQITDGPWDDIEPAYLPDGGIVFCSSRCERYIGCWLAPTAVLHRCDGTGENIRMLSSGSFTENTPAVLADGRVLYTRWEYVNRDPVSFHHLWTVSPDGTSQMVYFGNMHPGGVFIDARPVRGTDNVVMIHSPGHGRNEHAGYVAVISSQCGPDAKSAMRQLSHTADYRDPSPLSKDTFLVARGNDILLMNSSGETELLYHAEGIEVHEPRPLCESPREAVLLPRVDLTKESATLVLHDVYAGRNMGVPRGEIKKLLVLEDLPKPANYHGGGSQPIGHGVTSTLKRILGTVPVEPDGSAYFEVPAMRSLYFVALDDRDRSVKQMRSFVTLQPGETLSCVGCHEQRTTTPRSRRPRLALNRPPSPIEPIRDVPSILDFPRDVQPILDRHCVRCHGPNRRDAGVMLSGDHGPVFSLSYYELLLHWQVKDTRDAPQHGSGRQPGNDPPYGAYSSASPLMDKIDGRHYEVKLSERERRIVRLWIDSGAQYAGTYAAYGTGQIGGCWGNNRPVRVMANEWPSTSGAVDAVQRRCGSCHPPKQLPRHVTDQIPLDAWGDMLSWVRPLSRYSRHRLYNLSRPEKSLVLLAPLSCNSGGYAEGKPISNRDDAQPIAEDRSRPPRPIVHPVVFADEEDPDFQAFLAHIRAANRQLEEIKRFDMPGFKPRLEYVREMKRYGVLPASFNVERDAIDVYATDKAYWRSLWHQPQVTP